MTSVGFREPLAALRPMIVVGTRVMLEVFMARKVHMASVAVSGSLLSFCISAIAFNPKGVAALPKPSRFALMFISMAPIAGWPAGIEGKRNFTNGYMTLLMNSINPDFSAIRAIPSHRLIIPAMAKILSIAPVAELIAVCVTASILP